MDYQTKINQINFSKFSKILSSLKIISYIATTISAIITVINGVKLYLKAKSESSGIIPRYRLDEDTMKIVPVSFSDDNSITSQFDLYIDKKRLNMKSDIFIGKYKSLFNLPLFAVNLRLDSDNINDEDKEVLASLREQYLDSFRDWRDYKYSEVLMNPSNYNLMKFRNEQILKNNEMEKAIVRKYLLMKGVEV